MRKRRGLPTEGQGWHALALAVLLAALALAARAVPLRAGSFLGRSTTTWLIVAVAVPIAHQVFVTVVWRARLARERLARREGALPDEHRGAGRLRPAGASRAAFVAYLVGFFALFVGRMVTVVLLAVSNAVAMPVPAGVRVGVAVILMVPAGYTFISVTRHFGLARAAGADHFDPAYREVPFVRRGIFRYTNNAMYLYGLLVLWIPGVLAASPAALLVAAFQHAYVWVHYYCTELPDMRRIYGRAPADDAG